MSRAKSQVEFVNVGSHEGIPRDDLVDLQNEGELQSGWTLSPAIESLRRTKGLPFVTAEGDSQVGLATAMVCYGISCHLLIP